jgi:hypothetical protein
MKSGHGVDSQAHGSPSLSQLQLAAQFVDREPSEFVVQAIWVLEDREVIAQRTMVSKKALHSILDWVKPAAIW